MRRTILPVVLALLALAPARGAADSVGDPPHAIVSVEWLKSALATKEGVSVVDVREAWEYAFSHVKGAAFGDPTMFIATVSGLPGMIPPPEALTALAKKIGIRRDRGVVFYGRPDQPLAARAALTFRLCGHARSFWLDGGVDAAKKAGLPMEAFSEAVPPGDFVATALPSGVVDGEWVKSHLGAQDVILIDTRSKEEFEAGRIPGARRVEWKQNLKEGSLRDEGDLWRVYGEVGLKAEDRSKKTVVCYCAIGTRASVNTLVLQRLGFERVELYDGSWTEWSKGSYPIEKGNPPR